MKKTSITIPLERIEVSTDNGCKDCFFRQLKRINCIDYKNIVCVERDDKGRLSGDHERNYIYKKKIIV